MCVNITQINVRDFTLNTTSSNVNKPYSCRPGKDTCDYMTPDSKIQFNLTCECSLKNESTGYCPLPVMTEMQQYIKAIKQVWF